jgi:hypothetical protein
MNNSPEVFVLKGDVPQNETGHVHGAGCGCGPQGASGVPAPAKPKPVGFLARMQQAQRDKHKTTEFKYGRNVPKSLSATGPSGEPGPTGKPKKKKRDWAAEIRQLRQDGA